MADQHAADAKSSPSETATNSATSDGLAETISKPIPSTLDISELKGTQMKLPKVTIEFCVQCKWGLRAAYYAQELLSTFSSNTPPSISEISLIPSPKTGIFTIKIHHPTNSYPQNEPSTAHSPPLIRQVTTCFPNTPGTLVQTFYVSTLWDRKIDGGFPETKELKRRVRDVVEPGRNLGHVDREYSKKGEDGGKDRRAGGEVKEVGVKASSDRHGEELVHGGRTEVGQCETGKEGECKECR